MQGSGDGGGAYPTARIPSNFAQFVGLRSSYYRHYALKIVLEYAFFRRKKNFKILWGGISLLPRPYPLVYQPENETTGYGLQAPTFMYSAAKANHYKQ